MLIIICDDENTINLFIKKKLEERYDKNVECILFTTSGEMVDYITTKRIPDIVIADICVGEDNAILELKKIKKTLDGVPVIFITGYMEYCQDIFLDFQPWGLLTKPIDEEKLFYHIDNIIYNFNYHNLSISILNKGSQEMLKNDDIMYIESRGRKVIYHTKNGEYEEYIKLDAAFDKLKIGFLRCHKSYAVNMDYIDAIFDTKIILKNKTEVPVSRAYKENIKNNFFEHKSKKIGL